MDDNDDESGKRKRHKYVSKACAHCQRRKIKCDGLKPCAHCTAISTQCEYVEGKARGGARISSASIALPEPPSSADDDLQERLSNLERKVDELSQGMQNAKQSSDPDSTSLPMYAINMMDEKTPLRRLSFGLRRPPPERFYGHASSLGTLSDMRHKLTSMTSANTPKESEVSRKSITPEDGRAFSPIIYEPVSLPSMRMTFELLDTMFEDLMSLYPLLHSPTFFSTYSPLWNKQGEFQRSVAFGDGFTESELGLLYACLAATAVLKESRADTTKGLSSASKGFYLSAKLLILDNLERPSDVPTVQAMILLAMYYLHVDNEDAAYKVMGLAIRMCFELGLHLRSNEVDCSSQDIELRRRAFFCLYLFDLRTSITLGRPNGIRNDDMDLPFPTPIDDQTLFPEQMDTPIVLEHSKIPYLVHFVQFSSICGDIHNKIYGLKRPRQPQMETIQEFDKIIETWRSNLPDFLHFDPNSVSTIPKWLGKQSLFLYLRSSHVRLLLLKPFVSEVEQGTMLQPGSNHYQLVDFAIQLSGEIIHTVSLVKRSSDLIEMLWYPVRLMLLTTIMIIFSVVLNFHADTKFSSLSLKADLRVALQLLKDFSEKSLGSTKNLRDIQFLRYLLNQALKSSSNSGTSQSSSTPARNVSVSTTTPGAVLRSESSGAPPDFASGSDISFLDMTAMNENDLLMDLLDSMGDKNPTQMFLAT